MKKIFIATPISGFDNWHEYESFRINILTLIEMLRQLNYHVWSEIELVGSNSEYDTPEQSVKKDIQKIKSSDIFILIHPRKMQTSTLFELGYAFSLSKDIIIVGEERNLPYMAKGLNIGDHFLKIVESDTFDELTLKKIVDEINGRT